MLRSRVVGHRGSGPSPENYKAIGFVSNTGLDPLENQKATKLPSQHSILGHHWPASETPLKWRFAAGRMLARFWLHFNPLSSPHQRTPPPPEKKQTLSDWSSPGSAHVLSGSLFYARNNTATLLLSMYGKIIYQLHVTKN